MEAFTQAFADFFSWLSGFTFEIVLTAIEDWLFEISGGDFHWGSTF
ncbi:MAG: hypothetical protein LBN05_00525 [Oscillospiraceae bacterium]|jgi:hypothetical protein|nr:hypothetical protein [Oscillospiraceae bacterium]